MTLIDKAIDILREKLYIEDEHIYAYRGLITLFFSRRLDPIAAPWSYFSAPPSSLKSVMLKTLREFPDAYFGAEYLSEASLASGYKDELADLKRKKKPDESEGWRKKKKGKEEAPSKFSLAPLLDKKTLIIHDWTQMCSAKDGQMARQTDAIRLLFEGELNAEFGNSEGGSKHKAVFGLIAGVTPEIDVAMAAQVALGGRFLCLRFHPQNKTAADIQGMKNQAAGIRKWFEELPHRIFELFKDIPMEITDRPSITDEQFALLSQYAQVVAKCRTEVKRRGRGTPFSAPMTMAIPEASTRLSQQIMSVAQTHAFICGRSVLTEDDLILARRIARETMPMLTFLYLESLFVEEHQTLDSIHKQYSWNYNVHREHFDDFVQLKIATAENVATNAPTIWTLTPEFRKHLNECRFFE